jgi:N-acetylglutamate synthase-like GNAT family acetyltransferase
MPRACLGSSNGLFCQGKTGNPNQGVRASICLINIPKRMTQLDIRQATHQDAAQLSQLICDNANQYLAPHYSTEQLAVFLSYYDVASVLENLSTQRIFCAEREGQIIGTVGLNGVLVVGFYTHIAYQRQGIGQALMAHLHADAISRGMDRLELFASPVAASFYLKIGYTLQAVQNVFYRGVAFEETHMQIELR